MDPTGSTAVATTHSSEISAGAIVGIAVLALSTFFAITTELMPVGLLSTMSTDLHVTQATMGIVVTIYAASVAILALPLTTLTARVPRKTILVITLIGYAVSNLLVALAPNFAAVCVGRVIGGISHALFFSVASAYATRIVPPRLAGRAIAFVYSGSSLGFVIGVPVATTVADGIGWRYAVGGVALCTALLSATAILFLPAVHGTSHPHTGSPHAWARTGLISVVVADLLLFAAHYTVYTFIESYLVHAGLAHGWVSGALLALGVAGAIGLWAAGMFVDRAPRQTLVCAVAVMAAAFIALPLLQASIIGTMIGTGVWMAANGTTGTLFMAAAIRTGGASPDIAGALINGASNIGIAGGAALGSQLLNTAGLGVLPFGGAAIAAGAFAVIMLARRGFPLHGHSQPHLSTSSIEAVTTSMQTITTSMPTLTRSIQTITGSVAARAGRRRRGEKRGPGRRHE